MKSRARVFVGMMCALTCVSLAGAGVPPAIFDYTVFKTRVIEQVDQNQPTSFLSYSTDQRLFGANITPTSVGNPTVTFPDMSVRPLNEYVGDAVVTRFEGPFVDEAALDAATPSGTYQFNISGGTLGTAQGTMSVNAVNLWSNVPFVTNWSDMQSFSTLSDFTVTYNMPELDPLVNNGGVFWDIVDLGTNTIVLAGFNGFADPTDIFIPGGTLAGNTNYTVRINFSARVLNGTGTGAMLAALGQASWDTSTRAFFTTPPASCQGDANFDGRVDFADITSVLINFGNVYTPSTGQGDADRNGSVEFTDITVVLLNFGTLCS